METIATAIVPVILQPAITELISYALSNSNDEYQDNLRSLSSDVSFLKSLLGPLSDRLNSSTGRLSESLPVPIKHWLERWKNVIEEAENTIEDCDEDNEGSISCLPRRNNMKKVEQAKKKIKETLDMALFIYMMTGLQNGGNVFSPLRRQRTVNLPMAPVVPRLQDTASSLTIGNGFNGQPLCWEFDTCSTDFALKMGSCNSPISVIVNCNKDEGNPLAHNVGNPPEMTIECCQEQISFTTNVERVLQIEALSEEKRREFFRSQAYKNRDLLQVSSEMEDTLRKIFRSIAAKPFLIEGVAHILAKFSNLSYWQLKLALFSLPPEHLYDRYNALPKFIKPCFLSFAAFPQAEEIDVENLVELWIAEGLVSIKHELIDLVSFGYQVMKLLVRYSLIEVSVYDWAGRPVCCTLPNRIHNMAVQILDQEEGCFFRPRQNLEQFSWPQSHSYSSISLICNKIESLPRSSGSSSVRSLLLAGNIKLAKVPTCFLQGLTSLRVLDLSDTGVDSLPSSLGDLRNLIHLNLSRTQIVILPKKCIRYLKKLRSLLLSSCTRLKSLSLEICKLQSLKLLDVSGCKSLKSFSHTIKKLKKLQVLKINKTQVWHSKCGFLQAMGLGKLLFTCRIAILSDLKNLSNLKRLHLDSEKHSLISDGVMGNLTKMQSLWLRMTKLKLLPKDMSAMTELTELHLWKCMKLQELPSWVCKFFELRFLCLNCCTA